MMGRRGSLRTRGWRWRTGARAHDLMMLLIELYGRGVDLRSVPVAMEAAIAMATEVGASFWARAMTTSALRCAGYHSTP